MAGIKPDIIKGGINMSFPLKSNLEQASQFLLGFLQSLMNNPETAQAWSDLDMVVGVKLLDLDLGYTLNCSTEGVEISPVFPENPDAGISFSSDTFHDLFTGKLNPMMSLATGKIKTSGSTKNVLKVANILPQNFKAYVEYLKSQGLS